MASTTPEVARRKARRRWLWIIASVGVAIIVVITILVAVAGSPGAGDGSASNTAVSTGAPGVTDEPATTSPTSTESPSAEGEPSLPEQAPVDFDEPATTPVGIVVSTTSLTAIDGEAEGIGEISGPAVKVDVSVRNDSAEEVSLTSTVVSLYFGSDAAPAVELTESGGSSLPDTVAPGVTVSGSFIFTVPADQREQLKVTFDYQVGSPMVVFEGAGPKV